MDIYAEIDELPVDFKCFLWRLIFFVGVAEGEICVDVFFISIYTFLKNLYGVFVTTLDVVE